MWLVSTSRSDVVRQLSDSHSSWQTATQSGALADALVERGAAICVVDDLSSSKIENIQHYIADRRVEFMHADLRQPRVAQQAVGGVSVVFHLAPNHGGRGYVDLQQAACASNLTMDGMLFLACRGSHMETER